MGEKSFQTRAEVVEAVFAVRCSGKSVFRTSPVARGKNLAIAAVSGERIPLVAAELPLRRVLEHFHERSLADIPDAVLRVDKMVAGIEVPVMFDDHDIAAGLLEDAERMFQSKEGP